MNALKKFWHVQPLKSEISFFHLGLTLLILILFIPYKEKNI